MARLIDADKFEAFMIRTNGDEEFVNGVQYVLEKIDNAPTVDAIPVSEIENLLKEMLGIEIDNVKITDKERNMLWTCTAMIDDMLEQYKENKDCRYRISN